MQIGSESLLLYADIRPWGTTTFLRDIRTFTTVKWHRKRIRSGYKMNFNFICDYGLALERVDPDSQERQTVSGCRLRDRLYK
jgi:hypothetical protein